MSDDTLTQSLLAYITHNTYPDSESISSSTLPSCEYSTLLSSLQTARSQAQDLIRSLSRNAAPDIDEWISRAKELQADILRSRDTARQIVLAAEAGEKLRAEAEDTGKKVEFLEREVGFNETLTGTLEHVRHANGLLERAQEDAVRGNVEGALKRLEDAESSIGALESDDGGGRAVDVLKQRASQLREGLVETATECWNALLAVNVEEKSLRIQSEGLDADVPGAAVPEISLEAVVTAAKGLDILDELVRQLSKNIERAILRPRMQVDDNGQVAKLSASGHKLSCLAKISDLSSSLLFQDLRLLVDFISSRVPPSIGQALSHYLIPSLTSRLESQWLDPAIPVSISQVADFETLLASVTDLADHIESLSWNGTEGLREWVQNAPRAWLTKRREVVLGEVRNLVFTGLREREVVERVETRVVSKEDAGAIGAGGEDDWDEAWDEPEEEGAAAVSKSKEDEDEDEDEAASAWDLADDDYISKKEGSTDEGGEEDDAWGWGDDDTPSQKPPSPVATKKAQPSTIQPQGSTNGQQQEMTLRETFTITSIPPGILEILQTLISDAQTLSGPDYESTHIAPASTALYTLPTLALAIYRATVPTAYSKLDVGNMLIYNDASRLADQLREWQSSAPPGSRLKVDNDVNALQTFAKRAYTSEMDSQRTILRDLLDGAQGFGNCGQQPFKRECENAVESVVARLRDVHALWKPILSQGALLQSLGSLLSTVTSKMITEIEEISDIGEAESLQLKSLCDKISTLKDIFTQSPSSEVEEGQEGQDMTFIYCPTWLKFLYLAEILESSLADIRWMWTEGELRLEFGSEEVVELVEALFAESELRRQAVREIRRGR